MRVVIRALCILGLLTAACTRSTEQAAPSPAPADSADGGSEPESAGEARLDPVQSVSLQPAEVVAGQTVQAIVEDPSRRIANFAWYVNGAEIPGATDDRLPGEYVKKNARITVRVSPVDRGQQGESTESDELVVGNSPPRITSIDLVRNEGAEIVLQAKTTDADADTLTYRLVNAPAGMQIDQAGQVTWTAPDELAAPVTFSVGVSDGEHEFIQESSIGSR